MYCSFYKYCHCYFYLNALNWVFSFLTIELVEIVSTTWPIFLPRRLINFKPSLKQQVNFSFSRLKSTSKTSSSVDTIMGSVKRSNPGYWNTCTLPSVVPVATNVPSWLKRTTRWKSSCFLLDNVLVDLSNVILQSKSLLIYYTIKIYTYIFHYHFTYHSRFWKYDNSRYDLLTYSLMMYWHQ